MDLDDQQDLSIRIKNFLAQDSQFRNPNFDPAPFLIKILKQKQSDHQALIARQQQLITLQNQAFQLVDEIANEYTDQIFKLIDVPKKMGQQLQKLKSNMSLVKKKVKQTKSLLMSTQKDIDQIYFNCMFNKLIYQKLKEIQIKLNQYESASLALKNNQFYLCSINMPSQIGNSVLESSLSSKAQNLKLKLLSRAIEEVSLFLYLTPKIVVPSTQSLLERAPGQQNLNATVSQHQAFYKRYLLFKKANCLQYLPTIWTFKDFQRKSGKIGLIFDIVKGIMNIGKINQIVESLQLDCKKSINSIFFLLQYYFSKQVITNQQSKNIKVTKKWFMCRKYQIHTNFISTILNICGAILRKLTIVRMIFKQYEVTDYNLNSKLMLQTLLTQLNRFVTDAYFKHEQKEDTQQNYLMEQIMQKITNKDNYIFWVFIKKILLKGLVTIEKNILLIEDEVFKPNKLSIQWQKIMNVSQLDARFYERFHVDFSKTLLEIFSHQGRSFAMQSLEQVLNFKQIGQKQTNFCKFFSSQQIKYTKQHVYLISLLQTLKQFFLGNQFSTTKLKKYCLFSLCTFYLKLNYYLQRFLISPAMIQKINQVRKSNNKVKAKQKDLRRQYFKLCSTRKQQIKVKPWRKNNNYNQQIELSKYRLVQKLKSISKQNQMLISYSMKFFEELQNQKYKDSPNLLVHIITIEKLQPTNYDQNLSSKLIRIWDQLPDSQEGILQITATIFQKLIQLHLTVVGIIYMEGSE